MAENKSLEQYINSRRQAGATDIEIRSELTASGWDDVSISKELTTFESQSKGSSIKNIKIPLLVVAGIILLVVVAVAWYFSHTKYTDITSDVDHVLISSSSPTPKESATSSDAIDTYEMKRRQSTNDHPYVAALSDVEQIINAVYRYYAFQGTYPQTLQDLVDKEELKQSFVDRKQDAYSLSFSATNADDCKVVATFKDGRVITSMCADDNYHEEFEKYYDVSY